MKIYNDITGKTRIIGIIGNPLEHSISPQLHNSISRYLGIDLVYIPFKVESDNLGDAVKGLKALNVLGFNITIPYKHDILKYLDEIKEEAQLMGAVNTVKNSDGRLCGFNTDAEGFLRSFTEATGEDFKNKKVVLLGAGGAARAIAVKVAMEGAGSISIMNRNHEKAAELAGLLNNNILPVACGYNIESAKAKDILRNCNIIINTTPSGMYPNIYETPITDLDLLSKGQIVYDTIYNPQMTLLLQHAHRKGCKIINGMGMLFYQGIQAYEIWTGTKIDKLIANELYEDFKNLLIK